MRSTLKEAERDNIFYVEIILCSPERALAELPPTDVG